MARIAGFSKKKELQTVREILAELLKISPGVKPPVFAGIMQKIISSAIPDKKNLDIYWKIKRNSNDCILKMYAALQHRVNHSSDSVYEALRLTAVGNIIDYAAFNQHTINIRAEIEKLISTKFTKEHVRLFKKKAEKAETLLLICDNAGEIVFDMLLVTVLQKEYPSLEIIAAVRDIPVLNDATILDAEQIKLGNVCRVISSGSRIPGTVLKNCSSDFRNIFRKADIVISKGQGNYETLHACTKKNLFFSFITKCNIVSVHAGFPRGSLMFITHKRK